MISHAYTENELDWLKTVANSYMISMQKGEISEIANPSRYRSISLHMAFPYSVVPHPTQTPCPFYRSLKRKVKAVFKCNTHKSLSTPVSSQHIVFCL